MSKGFGSLLVFNGRHCRHHRQFLMAQAAWHTQTLHVADSGCRLERSRCNGCIVIKWILTDGTGVDHVAMVANEQSQRSGKYTFVLEAPFADAPSAHVKTLRQANALLMPFLTAAAQVRCYLLCLPCLLFVARCLRATICSPNAAHPHFRRLCLDAVIFLASLLLASLFGRLSQCRACRRSW